MVFKSKAINKSDLFLLSGLKESRELMNFRGGKLEGFTSNLPVSVSVTKMALISLMQSRGMTSQNLNMRKHPVYDVVPGQLTSRAMVSKMIAFVMMMALGYSYSYLLYKEEFSQEHPPHLSPKEMFLLQGFLIQ